MEKLECQVNHIWVITKKATTDGIQNFEKSFSWGLRKLFGFEVEQICKNDEVVAKKVVPDQDRLVVSAFCSFDTGCYQVLVVVR